MKETLLFLLLMPLVTAASERPSDPISSLIESQTNQSSEAGQRGDQKMVDALTDENILFSAGDGTVQRDEKLDEADALSSQLREMTVAEHAHAGKNIARGHAEPSMFVDENGFINSESDFRNGRGQISDWVAHRKNDVVVSSFTIATNLKRYLAVEIWLHHRAAWHLVAGQTIPLYDDPPVAHLSNQALHDFSGTYSAGPGSIVEIEVGGDDDLSVAQVGAPPRHLKPEGGDVFFYAGLPPGYPRSATKFERDHDGRVERFVRAGVIFKKTDKGESIATEHAPSAGPLRLRDFRVLHLGNLAIATFYHDRDTDYYGQTVHQTFQSMESWINEDGMWKMISSQGHQI